MVQTRSGRGGTKRSRETNGDDALYVIDTAGSSRKRKRTRVLEPPRTAAHAAAPAPSASVPTAPNRKQRRNRKRKKGKAKRQPVPVAAEDVAALAVDTNALDIWGAATAAKRRVQERGVRNEEGFTMALPTKAPIQRRNRMREQRDIVAVPLVPHAGASFHPAPEAHARALQQAIDHEERLKAEHEAILEALRPRSRRQDDDDDDENPNHLDQGTVAPANDTEDYKRQPQRPYGKRYTEKERKRLQRQRAHRLAVAQAARRKAVRRELQTVPEILEALEEESSRVDKKHAKKAHEGIPRRRKTRLGRMVYKETVPEVLLSEELGQGTFSELTPSIRTVKDAFDRFQRAHVIAPRRKLAHRRQARVKVYKKHKDL